MLIITPDVNEEVVAESSKVVAIKRLLKQN